jgi:hypothetical protein
VPQANLSATAPASGAVTLTFRIRGTEVNRVTQVSTEMTAGSAASVSSGAVGALRLNGRLVAPFVPQGDAVGGDPPVDVGPTDDLTVEFTGATPGNVCAALIFYRQLRPGES